jgi:hypothetical protein
MDTRHLISIYMDGEVKLAQYGQWDGYLSGQGEAIVAFLREVDLAAFRKQVGKTRMLTEKEVTDRWEAAGATPGAPFVGMDVSNRFKAAHPQLSRDSGCETLSYIMEAESPEVGIDSTSFAADSLFCEWAYVIDLDKNLFEVYEGFQEEPHTSGRFWDLPHEEEEHQKGQPREYWPVKLKAAFSLSNIPEDWVSVVEGGDMEALANAHRDDVKALGV